MKNIKSFFVNTQWDIAFGGFLVCLCIAITVYGGWVSWLYLFVSLPLGLSHGTMHLDEFLFTIYSFSLPLMLFTGFSLLIRSKASFILSVLSIVYFYIVSGIWFAIGYWPVRRVFDGGSAQESLSFGDKILIQGDYGPYVINPQHWIIMMAVNTVVFAFIMVMFLRHFKPGQQRRIP